MIHSIKAKSILSTVRQPDDWFGLKYNMNLYRGCQHQCIYCDSRSDCYQIADFSDILIKENAIELLASELAAKRVKGTIGTGSMNDPYMPIEKNQKLTRRALELISKFNFPIHVITKSDLVLRDLDLLQKISRRYAAVSFSIIATDDHIGKRLEPGASLVSDRFRAIRELSRAGIYCGITLMPVLPLLLDNPENIRRLVEQATAAGAKYILAWFGLSMRNGQREYFYRKLDLHFPGLKEKYIQLTLVQDRLFTKIN
jgi:DNA repair photolyase